MYLSYQENAINALNRLAETDSHSILISGIRGSGKTYLAKLFAGMKDITTFNVVYPKVSDLKSTIEDSYKLQDKQVICIENLESGTDAACQVILKFLEEPQSNVYIIVTCVNPSKLPSTILSRVISVPLPSPNHQSLVEYAKYINESRYDRLKNEPVMRICKSLTDIHNVFDLSVDRQIYYKNFVEDSRIWSQSVDSISWMLTHFEDNSKTDLNIVFRVIYEYLDARFKRSALNALMSLESGKLSESAIVGKFILEVKYK